MGVKVSTGSGSILAASMGFSLSKTRLEIFFDFELFSSSNKGFLKTKRHLASNVWVLCPPAEGYQPPSPLSGAEVSKMAIRVWAILVADLFLQGTVAA